MRFYTILAVALVLVLATSVSGLEKKAVQMKEDYGTEPLYDCYMNYYYYIPCPTYSWFWNFTGWPAGQVVGEWFTVGDPSMGRAGSGCPPYIACDPNMAHTIEQFRILDFAGYGTAYPGLFTVEFDIWCADERGCPLAPSLWNSGPKEFCTAGWNVVPVTPPLCVTRCATIANPPSYPRFLITAKHIGTQATYPAWGFDNISTPITQACVMHDTGCCPALYPRPSVSHYTSMHSGDYGINFAYCPPYWILNPGDSTGDVYGCIELAWRVYLQNSGPTATEPSTWGHIKSMYR
jgi:hypothetical protein